MNLNPFATSEVFLQTPLTEEMQQRIHALALRRAAQGYVSSAIPKRIDIEYLKHQIERGGPDVCFRHPTEVAEVFTGMTFAFYRAVETLYCTRIGRSIPMIWHILTAMAQKVGAAPVSYEAIWALCVFLERQRHASVDVSIERGQECWWIGKYTLDITLQEVNGCTKKHPSVLCVIDTTQPRVLSFQLASEETCEQHLSFALFTALLASRRPHRSALTGILWHLPKRIMTEMPLPSESTSACCRLGIVVEAAIESHSVSQMLQSVFLSHLAGQVLSVTQCERLLDRSLEKAFGHGPLRLQAQQSHDYAHLIGYAQEPDWLFPLLRVFLPRQFGTISSEGMIEYDNLHYADDLLPYFVNTSVTLRRSPYAEASLWVYVGQEILCLAKACELRRHDGTYRRSRLGR